MIPYRVAMFDEQDGETEVALPGHWVICHTCDGAGKSSAHLGAFSRDEMEEEGQEFMEDYVSGLYDRACDACGGSGKVLEPDRERIEANDNDEQIAALRYLDRTAQEDAEDRATQRMESGHYSEY